MAEAQDNAGIKTVEEIDPGALAKRRILALVGVSFLNGLGFWGLMTLLPLHAIGTLGLSAATYSRVLSLRMGGIVVGAIVLGAVSDRLGARRMTLVFLRTAGVLLALICIAPVWGFFVLVPIISGLISACFVNLNQLTQSVGNNRQGVANTFYRATGTGAGMVAPIAVSHWINQAHWLMGGIGVGLFFGAWCLKQYPVVERIAPMAGLGTELRAVARGYREGVTHREMMAYMLLSIGVVALATCVDAFGAVRLTRELDAPARAYGDVLSISSGLTLVSILLLGIVLDRVPLKVSVVGPLCVWAVSLCCLGASTTVFWTQVFMIACLVSVGASLAPMMMWIGRVAGKVSLGGAFALHKVMTAAFMGLAMLAMSVLEPMMGIRWLFVACGVLGGVLLVFLAMLREPGKAVSKSAAGGAQS